MSSWTRVIWMTFVAVFSAADTCLSLDQFLIEHQRAVSINPGEVDFSIRFKGNKDRFRQGEIIQVELSFASTAKDKYQLDGAQYDRSGRLEIDSYHLDPSDGASDPLHDRQAGGIMGGIRSAPILDPKPYLITRDLNEYVRIDRPGKYRLYVVSNRVRTVDRANHNLTSIAATSSIIEFTIVPMETAWSKKQFESAIAALERSNHLEPMRRDEEIHSAVRVLRYLGTEDAVRYMVRHFTEFESDFGFGLIGSPHRAMVIEEMEDGIEKPDYPITDWYLWILTTCRHPHRMAPYPGNEDKAKLEAWEQQESKAELARTAIRDEYVNRLASAIPGKQGSARAISLNTLLADTMRQPKDRLSANTIRGISTQLTNVFFDLPAKTQCLLLEYQWSSIKSPGMLPVLEKFYAHPSQETDTYHPTIGGVALRHIYELDPKRGRELILKEIADPTGRASFDVLSMLPDRMLPEMDEPFAAALEEQRRIATEQLPLQMKLLARYGTPAILPRVKSAMQRSNWSFSCEAEAPIIAYFLRADPAFGAAELEKTLTRRSENDCNEYVLGVVAELYPSLELESAAIRHLNDPEPEVVLQSVEVLGKHGSAEAEEPLLKRFQKWHDEWKDRKEELQSPMFALKPDLFIVHRMETAFRTALANAQGWIADAAKLKVIQSFCLTDQERNQVGYRISEADAPKKRLSFRPGLGDDWSLDIAQYHVSSLEAAKNKLAQFPKGTVFLWIPFNAGQAEEQKRIILKELKSYLIKIGMVLEEQ
ncbi:MAG: hypothetical protein JXA73_25785 [Acidobacteria bacterium]|nr:hypothetical protein [Acidobacteriota bacterium]